VRIAAKAKKAGVKMGVTMSHRFDRDKTTLREEIRSGRAGPLDYIVCRFTCAMREFGAWGRFRHEITDPLLIEGAVHHLDLLADMTGSTCETIYARTWNPPWGQYGGDSQALLTMTMENGAHAFYEGAKTNAAGLNCWTNEYIRAQCRDATLILDHREIERFPASARDAREGAGEKVSLLDRPKRANAWLIEKFVRWLDGGEPMETNVEANLQSVALVFAAIESSRTGAPIAVQNFLEKARKKV